MATVRALGRGGAVKTSQGSEPIPSTFASAVAIGRPYGEQRTPPHRTPASAVCGTKKGSHMAARTAVAQRTIDRSHLRDGQLDALRGLLDDALAEQRHQYRHNEAVIDVILEGGHDGDTGQDRELARLAAGRARDAIDEIEDALLRLARGTYGICESCGRSISFERLE